MKLLAKQYTLDILMALKEPKRYKDLKSVCKNDRTLSNGIKELQELSLIEPVAVKEKGKYVNFYKLTRSGEDVLDRIEKLRL